MLLVAQTNAPKTVAASATVVEECSVVAVVAVLGDSGPGTETGKQFGGSPEVMASLGFYPKATRGDVVVLFLDDPADTIPLGPMFIKGE